MGWISAVFAHKVVALRHPRNGLVVDAGDSRLPCPAGSVMFAPHVGLVVTAVVYSTYGLSRLVTLAYDGVPSPGLVIGMGIELGLGAIAAAALLTGGGFRARGASSFRE